MLLLTQIRLENYGTNALPVHV